MPYATPESFALAFGAEEATDLSADDPDRLAQALDEASAEADSHIATRHPVPIAQPGARLRQVVQDIARFRLYDNRSSEEVRTRYEDARRWLQDVASGKALILDASGQPLLATASPSATVRAGTRSLVYGPQFECRYTTPQPPTPMA